MQYANPTLANNFQFENKLEKEIYESKNRAKITFHVLNKIANDIDSMISFTNDVPENYDDMKMPVLDLKVYLDKNNILLHEFFEKPTKNPLVTLASSALPWRTKRTVFTQEAIRRMRNTSQRLPPETADRALSKYMLKL